jgi:hypothetical protein
VPRRAISLLLVLNLFACPSESSTPSEPVAGEAGEVPVTKSSCPAPTEGCMNADNHKACLEAEAKCPGKVLTLESCPLQFACED